MHNSVKVFDKSKRIQKMLNLVGEDSSSSDEEEEEPVIDTIKLKQQLQELKNNEGLVINEKYFYLHNLRFKKGPDPKKNCPCEREKLYKDCCQKADMDFRQKLITEIENFLKEEDQQLNKLVYV